jgi:DNA transformation protein
MELTDLLNIGITLEKKLKMFGINNGFDLAVMGSENEIIKISAIENNCTCINMLYALEGAIQGIRWHDLNIERKQELKDFFNRISFVIRTLTHGITNA